MLTQSTTIASLIQHGIGTMGQTTQEKSEVRRNKYESILDTRGYCLVPWTQVHPQPHQKNMHQQEIRPQERIYKTNIMGGSTPNLG